MSRPATSGELQIARQLCPDLSWEDAAVNEGGQFHKVVIGNPQAVIRMARTPAATEQMPRTVELLSLLKASSTIRSGGGLRDPACRRAQLSSMSFIPGSAHEPHYGDPKVLGQLVKELAEVPLEQISAHLAKPFSFRGEWTQARQQQCFDALPEELRAPATALWDQLDIWRRFQRTGAW
ncbi:hypothetical protein [Glutamicibacter nicotianae]|uniref:hypothetical protein n=1 Tax=Glutamicibacter nicotianae TaxID=37929 RepID=UPI0031D9121A